MTTLGYEKVDLKTVWTNALKTFGKIVLCFVLVFYFCVSLLFLIAPKVDAKIFNFFGLKKAEETCYVRIYEQSEDNADLYNLIVFEGKQGENLKQLQYINMLLADGDYEEFCVGFNNSAVTSLMNEKLQIKNKKLVPHIANVNSYLLNQKVLCMFDLNFENKNIWKFISSNLESVNIFEYSITTYLNLVENDNLLTASKKKELIQEFLDFENHTQNIETLLNERIADIENYLNGPNLPMVGEIIALNTMVNLRLAEYQIDVMLGNDSTASKSAYNSAVEEYNLKVI